MDMNLTVSVVVPVYNNENTIAGCLDSIINSKYTPIEIIVVDDGSNDKTLKIVKEYSCKLLELGRNKGVGTARNVGAKVAKGDLIFFTDGDVTIRENTIEIGVQKFLRDQNVAAIMGSYTKNCGADNFFSVYKNLLHHHTHQTSSKNSFSFLGSCGMIRKTVFDEIGGFDNSFFNFVLEDVDLGHRLYKGGYTILLEKEMQVTHHKRYSLLKLLHSDLFKRAIPWTRLILRHRFIKFDLCTRVSDIMCVTIAFSLLLSFVLIFLLKSYSILIIVILLTIFIILNFRLFTFFYRTNGMIFTIKSVFIHYVYYIIAGLGLIIGTAYHIYENRMKVTQKYAAEKN